MRLYLRGDGVAKHSYHIKGMAVDLRSERRSLGQVRDAALSLNAAGSGIIRAQASSMSIAGRSAIGREYSPLRSPQGLSIFGTWNSCRARLIAEQLC